METKQNSYDQGVAAYTAQKFEAASQFFEEVIKDEPKNWQAWRMLGYSSLATKATEKAIEAFESAIQLNEQDADNHFGLACAYQDSGNHAKAISAFENTLHKNPQHPLVKSKAVASYISRGDELMANANLMGAEQYFEKAYKFARNEETYKKLLDYYEKGGDNGKASLLSQEWASRNAPSPSELAETPPVNTQEQTRVLQSPIGTQHMQAAIQGAQSNAAFIANATDIPKPVTIQQSATGNFIPCPSCKKPMGIQAIVCPHCSHDIRKPTNSNFTKQKASANRITWQEVTYKIICVLWALAGVFDIFIAQMERRDAAANTDPILGDMARQIAESNFNFALIFGLFRVAVGVGLLFEVSFVMWIGYVLSLINIFVYGMGAVVSLGLMTINPLMGAGLFVVNAGMLAITGLFVYLLRFLGDI